MLLVKKLSTKKMLFSCKLWGEIKNYIAVIYRSCRFKTKSPKPQQLPPTADVLLLHCKRVSYATAMVKKCLTPQLDVPEPAGHGWIIKEGSLEIYWMLRKPAPDEVLSLVSCNCKKSARKTKPCICKEHGFVCTDICN